MSMNDDPLMSGMIVMPVETSPVESSETDSLTETTTMVAVEEIAEPKAKKKRTRTKSHAMRQLDIQPKKIEIGQIWIDKSRQVKVVALGTRVVTFSSRKSMKPGAFTSQTEDMSKSDFSAKFVCAKLN